MSSLDRRLLARFVSDPANRLRNPRSRAMLLAAGHSGWNEGIMRKLATAVAVAFAALSAHAALACEDKVETTEQPQHKPAVAEKTKKQTKQQQKAKKTDASDKTAVATAEKG